MAAASGPPLDETVWSAPAIVASMGGLHTDNVLYYFAESPFFDTTSNNSTLLNQARINPPAYAKIVSSRATFEAALRAIGGLEFVLVHDPSRNGAIPPHLVTGPWTIRKQDRKKGAGRNGEDMVNPLADYFIVEDRIYQAPTLGAVLQTKLLGTSKALTDMLNKINDLASFEAGKGRVYPTAESVKVAKSKNGINGSTDKTKVGEKKSAAPLTDTFDDYEDDDSDDDAALWQETMANFNRYRGEYMDEHPLVGEPGHFTVTTSQGNQMPLGQYAGSKKAAAIPALTVKTDLASAVNKREKGSEKSPLSPTGTGATKKRKKDKRGQTPREPKTPAP